MDVFAESRLRLVDRFAAHKVQLGPKRLPNLGNSCYINAVLQGLAHCELIHSFVKESSHCERCSQRQDCVRCAFDRCVSDLRRPIATVAHNPIARIVRILPHISLNGALMTSGRQEDAHEFLSNLLVTAQECRSNSCSPEGKVIAAADGNSNIRRSLRSLFQGCLSSSVYCTKCHSISTTKEAIQGLELEVDRAAALTTALAEYCGTETLSASSGNAYDCSKCRALTTAQKALRLASVPVVLRIQLKRFRYGAGRCEKLSHLVEYPELLDMGPYMQQQPDAGASQSPAAAAAAGDENDSCAHNNNNNANNTNNTAHSPASPSPSSHTCSWSRDAAGESASPCQGKSTNNALLQRDLQYRLAAVVVHLGTSPEAGHYTAYVRCSGGNPGSGSGSWYLTNDDTVTRATLQDALSQKAYVLLYERVALLEGGTTDTTTLRLGEGSPVPVPVPVPSSSTQQRRFSASSAIRVPGRIVSHNQSSSGSSTYYTDSGAAGAASSLYAQSSRSSADASNIYIGANPLFSPNKRPPPTTECSTAAQDYNISSAYPSTHSSNNQNSYLIEVKQRAAAAAAGGSAGAASYNSISGCTSNQQQQSTTSANGSGCAAPLSRVGGSGAVSSASVSTTASASAVPSRRVFGGYSRKRLFNSLNIFGAGRGKREREREKSLHTLHVLGKQQQQQYGNGDVTAVATPQRGGQVDSFFLHSQQQWDTPNTSTLGSTNQAAAAAPAEYGDTYDTYTDADTVTAGDSDSSKRRRLNRTDVDAGDNSAVGARYETRTSGSVVDHNANEQQQQSHKAATWVTFLPKRIRMFFSRKE